MLFLPSDACKEQNLCFGYSLCSLKGHANVFLPTTIDTLLLGRNTLLLIGLLPDRFMAAFLHTKPKEEQLTWDDEHDEQWYKF
jgi:hypothetical protein